ncbi:MAG: hypothetical protein M1822_003516 [Bathelium mastoideum]|nr:MAG: hypothetical protein M1822_003516 [Bathelium mastoideum]
MAQASKTLFSLPIEPDGSVKCEDLDQVYLLSFQLPPDNRLTTSFCQTLILALDILQEKHPPGVIITTSAIPKFYSNGLDLASDASSAPATFFPHALYALWARLLTYPWPTVALVNGHAFAGACMLALMHDYRCMNPHRGYLCLNELELGVPLRPAMMAVFRQKLGAATLRTLVLEARRYKALEALREGLVDSLGGLEECLVWIEELGLKRKAGGVYGLLRREMWRETVERLGNFDVEVREEEERNEREQKEQEERQKRVRAWETGKLSKL